MWMDLPVCLAGAHVPYLSGHPTPEVGVGRTGLQHGSHHGLVLLYEFPQHIWIGQDVVTVHQLKQKINWMDPQDCDRFMSCLSCKDYHPGSECHF